MGRGKQWSETSEIGEDSAGRQGPQWVAELDDDDNNNMIMMMNKNMKSTACARHCDALLDISALPCLSIGTHHNV